MQDLLKKIIEMDEQARKIEQQAKSEKLKSEEEVEALRRKIYDDYIERARDRVEKNIAVDEQHAKERIDDCIKETEEKKRAMRRRYADNKDAWVDEIVKRALS